MYYRDIVEFIKLHQVKQCISVKTLAFRTGVSPQVITDIRGYRLKVSAELFNRILQELSVTDLNETAKKLLLNNQEKAKDNKHKKYLKNKRSVIK